MLKKLLPVILAMLLLSSPWQKSWPQSKDSITVSASDLREINLALVEGNRSTELLKQCEETTRLLRGMVSKLETQLENSDKIIAAKDVQKEIVTVQADTYRATNPAFNGQLEKLKRDVEAANAKKKTWRKITFIGIPVAIVSGGVASLLIFK